MPERCVSLAEPGPGFQLLTRTFPEVDLACYDALIEAC